MGGNYFSVSRQKVWVTQATELNPLRTMAIISRITAQANPFARPISKRLFQTLIRFHTPVSKTFPHLGSDLVAALAGLKMHDFPHFDRSEKVLGGAEKVVRGPCAASTDGLPFVFSSFYRRFGNPTEWWEECPGKQKRLLWQLTARRDWFNGVSVWTLKVFHWPSKPDLVISLDSTLGAVPLVTPTRIQNRKTILTSPQIEGLFICRAYFELRET